MRSFTRPRAHIWLLAGALLLVSRPFSSPGGDHSQNAPRAAHIHRLSRVHGFNIRRGAFQVITRGSETCDRGSPMESDLQEPSRPVESCRFSAGDRSDLACPRGAVLPILSRRGSAGDIRQLRCSLRPAMTDCSSREGGGSGPFESSAVDPPATSESPRARARAHRNVFKLRERDRQETRQRRSRRLAPAGC